MPVLRTAVAELSWLLGRGYATPSAVKLVGDRHRLDERQRMALLRCACADETRARRQARALPADKLRARILLVDTYNVLTTVEAALAGGLLLLARDGCYRDLASMHGSFKAVLETEPALVAIGSHLSGLDLQACRWLLDSPVSNSGRLAAQMRELFQKSSWAWEVELVRDPDAVMRNSVDGVVATADSAVLDAARHWYNLARRVVDAAVPEAAIVDLSCAAPS